METKPYNLQAPESIAKEYGGNKQKIAQAVQMGIVNPTAALLAGMFIDRMRNAAPAEQAPTQTVAEEVFSPQPAPSMPTQGLAAMQQPQMPQGMPPQGMPPQGMPPQGMPPQGLAAMQQTQMPSMASGGEINYAEGDRVSGNPRFGSPTVFDSEIEYLKNQLRDTETENRRGLAERLKRITMSKETGDPAMFSDLPYDSSLIEFGERNRDLLGLKERARERVAEGTLSNDQFEAFGLEPAIGEVEYGARSRIRNLEEEIAEREAERQSAVSPGREITLLGQDEFVPDENGEVPGGLQSVIDFAPVPGEQNLGLQSEGNIGLQAPELQSEPGTLLDPQSYPGAPEPSRSEQTYADLQKMLTGVDKDSEMSAEAVQARADKEKREDTLTALAEFGFRMAASDSPYFLQAAGEAGAGTAPTFKDAISRSRDTVEDARKERALVDASARAERIDILKDSLDYLQGEDKLKAEKELKREEFALKERSKNKDIEIANIYASANAKESFAERQFKTTLEQVEKENPELTESQQRTKAIQILKGKTGGVTYEDFQPTYADSLERKVAHREATLNAITKGQMGDAIMDKYNNLADKPQDQAAFVLEQMRIRGPELMEYFDRMERKNQELMGITPPPSDNGGGKPSGKPGGKPGDNGARKKGKEGIAEAIKPDVKEGFEQGKFRGITNEAWGTLDQNKNEPSAVKEFAEKFGIEESEVLSALEAWQSAMDELPN